MFPVLVGLAGKTDLEAAQMDMIVDCAEDANKPIVPIFLEKDEGKKVQKLHFSKLADETLDIQASFAQCPVMLED